MYACEHCSAAFDNFYSLRAHKNGNRENGIPLCQKKTVLPDVCANIDIDDCASDTTSAAVAHAVITQPYNIQHEICRRHQVDSKLGPPHPLSNLGKESAHSYTGSINYGRLVEAFGEYCRWVMQSRSPKFWSLYLKTRHLHNDDQREILELVHKLFPGVLGGKRWCRDKRAVRYLLETKPFWPLVTYTSTCDLSAFQVPGLGRVTFTFVDPIFAWIIQARKLCKVTDLIFRYREARSSRSGEQTWGSCVSCGHAMRQVRLSGRVTR